MLSQLELLDLSREATASIKESFLRQGHNATGRGVESIRGEVYSGRGVSGVRVRADEYLLAVDRGISAKKVPFGKKSGGGSSKYVEGLVKWVVDKGIAPIEEAPAVAFAIANVASVEGHPTQGALKYSDTNRRTNFISEAIEGDLRGLTAQKIIRSRFIEDGVKKRLANIRIIQRIKAR